MEITEFSGISVNGKTAYVILCFEEYIKTRYPETDMTPVLELAWKIPCTPLDSYTYKFVEILPECLFEFDNYNSEFAEISEEEFYMFRKILNNTDTDLNALMKSIYNIISAYEGTRITDDGKKASFYLEKSINILENYNIPLPDINEVISYTSDKRDGWGDPVYPEGLSTML